jgi:hypothetical protein
VQVDVDQAVGHLVGFPDLLEQRLWHGHRSLCSEVVVLVFMRTPTGVWMVGVVRFTSCASARR